MVDFVTENEFEKVMVGNPEENFERVMTGETPAESTEGSVGLVELTETLQDLADEFNVLEKELGKAAVICSIALIILIVVGVICII